MKFYQVYNINLWHVLNVLKMLLELPLSLICSRQLCRFFLQVCRCESRASATTATAFEARPCPRRERSWWRTACWKVAVRSLALAATFPKGAGDEWRWAGGLYGIVAYCGLIGKLWKTHLLWHLWFDRGLCSQLREKMLWRDVDSIGELWWLATDLQLVVFDLCPNNPAGSSWALWGIGWPLWHGALGMRWRHLLQGWLQCQGRVKKIRGPQLQEDSQHLPSHSRPFVAARWRKSFWGLFSKLNLFLSNQEGYFISCIIFRA